MNTKNISNNDYSVILNEWKQADREFEIYTPNTPDYIDLSKYIRNDRLCDFMKDNYNQLRIDFGELISENIFIEYAFIIYEKIL